MSMRLFGISDCVRFVPRAAVAESMRAEFWEIFAERSDEPTEATIAANEQPLNRQSSNQH